MQARSLTSLDPDWRFTLAQGDLLEPYENGMTAGGYLQGPAAPEFDDSRWRIVDIPHDFVIEGEIEGAGRTMDVYPYDTDFSPWRGSYPTGVAWYRKRFSIPGISEGTRCYLFFDGVFRDSRVYLNGFFIGTHTSGYTSFFYDVSDFIEREAENIVAVRVDASRPEGWFYEGGGIYRHVRLLVVDPLHFLPWETRIIPHIDFKGNSTMARIAIDAGIINASDTAARGQLSFRLIDSEGTVAAEASSDFSTGANSRIDLHQEMEINRPRLWSLEEPNLYNLVGRIEADGQVTDEMDIITGLRSIRFDPDLGFFLNEKRVKIKGACCHQDHAGVGSALPDRLQEYRVEKLKDMGCNAWRSAHHPPSPELLDACDRMGMLVMVENRRLSSAEEDLRDMKLLVERDRNHPCVILWSMGNEEVFIQKRQQSVRIVRTLQDLIHRLDPTRPATLGVTFWDIETNKPGPLEPAPLAAPFLDVMGFNYSPDLWEAWHALHPRQPIVVSEASSNLRTRGCYRTDDELGHVAWDDTRAQARAEEQWLKVAESDFLSGIFIWTGFDYHGEPVPKYWPAVNSHFGAMDLCGFPKDNYFYYRAAWSDEPLVHVFPHWNWQDRIGEPLTVGCYSNCEEVELFLNGRSLGRKVMKKGSHLEWSSIVYEPGRLEARGMRAGQVAATHVVETTSAPRAVRVKCEISNLRADGADAAVLNLEIVDEKGRVVPTASNHVRFTIEGPGRLIGVGNGDPASHDSEKASHQRAFNGLCQAIILAGCTPGRITITASSPDLRPDSCRIDCG
jgi:beta-galactosidase